DSGGVASLTPSQFAQPASPPPQPSTAGLRSPPRDRRPWWLSWFNFNIYINYKSTVFTATHGGSNNQITLPGGTQEAGASVSRTFNAEDGGKNKTITVEDDESLKMNAKGAGSENADITLS